MGFAGLPVELVGRRHQDPEISRPADVGLGQARRALGDRAVADELGAADFDPFVAQARAHAGGQHLLEMGMVKKAVDTEAELAGFARVLVGAQLLRACFGVMD